MRPTWDEYFMIMAKSAALRSTCLSRSCGAVIAVNNHVVAVGYNGAMPGCQHCTDSGVCFRRQQGYTDREKTDVCRANHAEANAVAYAAYMGISLKGGTAYCTLQPCYTCTKLLASAGISRIVYEMPYESPDTTRDAIWRMATTEMGLSIDRLTIRTEIINTAIESLPRVTSVRRLP